MAAPGNVNPAPPPSSFDGDLDFFEESRFKKLKRKLVEEPLLPFGCALTCWALWEANKSIKVGDKVKTNRMFRRRIYAQGFTIVCMIGGQIYWAADREKRKQYEGLLGEQKRKEKREAWIRELEAREEEEQELKRARETLARQERNEKLRFKEIDKRALEANIKEDKNQPKGGLGAVQSAIEDNEEWGARPILRAVRELWLSR